MKQLVEITPLNMSSKLAYRCESCGATGYIQLSPPMNVDNAGEPLEPERLSDLPCPKM